MKTNNKGFSLVELIVVIAIMAVLAAVAIPTFAGFITKANKASDDQFLNDIEYAVQLANAAHPEKKITKVTVTTGTFALEYTYQIEGKDAVTVTSSSTGDDKAAYDEVLACIDQTYQYKAYGTKAEIANGTVTDTAD